MYKKTIIEKSLKVNQSYTGESIEDKINRIVNNNEPIKDGSPLIYTDRKHGVQAQYNIRTDRFEVALDAMDYVSKSHIATREHNANEKAKIVDIKKNDGGAEPIQATE